MRATRDFLLALLLLSPSGFIKSNSSSSSLSTAVVNIIRNFYTSQTSVIHILKLSQNEENNSQISDKLNEILENVENLDEIYSKRAFTVIFVDSYESFCAVLKKITIELFDFQGYYLIVFGRVIENYFSVILKVFEHLWMKYIVNVNVVVKINLNLDETLVYTYFPYSSNFCGEIFLKVIGRFSKNFQLHTHEYFPEKLHDMQQCPLNIAVFDASLFMIIKTLQNNSIELSGVDSRLLRYLADKMNFKPIYKISVDRWGTIFPNGTTTGAIKMVQKRQANFTLGYFSIDEKREKLMTPSTYYYGSQLVWIVPPGRLFTPFEKLFKPFEVV